MSYDYRILIGVLMAVGLVVYGVSQLPALTSGGSAGVNEAEFQAAVAKEYEFCREQPQALNCRCFANISGMIQVQSVPKLPGARYANKQELARLQASDSC